MLIHFYSARILCIRFHNIVLHVGAKRLVRVASGISLLLSVAIGIGVSIETLLISPIMLLSFFKDLHPSPETEQTRFKAKGIFTKSTATICISTNLIEFMCYVIIFIEMFKHHKRHTSLCLANKPQFANMVKRKNTITTVGHFTSWAAELLVFGSFAQFLAANEDKLLCFNWIFIRVLYPSINYVIFPSVQAIASPDLRKHMFNFEWCLCQYDSQAEEQIELQTMQNGNAHPIP